MTTPLAAPGGRLQFQWVHHQGEPAEEQGARLDIGKDVGVLIHGALVTILTCLADVLEGTNFGGHIS